MHRVSPHAVRQPNGKHESKKNRIRQKTGILPPSTSLQGSMHQGTKATISTFTISLSNCPPDTKGTFSFDTGPRSGGPPAGSDVTIIKISSSSSGIAPLFSTLHLKLSSSVTAGSGMGTAICGGLASERPIIGEWSMLDCSITGERYGPSRGL